MSSNKYTSKFQDALQSPLFQPSCTLVSQEGIALSLTSTPTLREVPAS